MIEPRRELHLFFATENSSVVILYRAKSDLFRLISWNTKGDIFLPGQWVKTTIYEGLCTITPNGKFFVFGGMQQGTRNQFMAISRPPFFTALEYFPNLNSFRVGGYFLNNTTVTLKCAAQNGDPIGLDCGLTLDREWTHWLHNCDGKYFGVTSEAQSNLRKKVNIKRGKLPLLMGCYHCEGAKLFRKTASGNQLLLDCSTMEFEAMKAPYRGIERSQTL